MKKLTDAQVIAKHYLIAALWADAPEGTNPRITKQAQVKAEKVAWHFLEIIGRMVLDEVKDAHQWGYGCHPDCGNDRPWLAAMGHDLWLTSQGHGSGFWDRYRELSPELRIILTNASHKFRGINLDCYRGWIYLRGNLPLSISKEATPCL